MIRLTQENFNLLKVQAADMMEYTAGGGDIKDVLTGYYIEGLENKLPFQGAVMAGKLTDYIESFDKALREALNNKERYLDKTLESMSKGLNEDQSLRLYAEAADAVSAGSCALAGEEGDPESIYAELLKKEASYGSAGMGGHRNDKRRVKEALSETGFMFLSSKERLDELKEYDENESIVAAPADDKYLRAALSMLVYINTRKENCPGPADSLNLEQTAAVVCAQAEEMRILENSPDSRIQTDLLSVLGTTLAAELLKSLVIYGIFPVSYLSFQLTAAKALNSFTAAVLKPFSRAYEELDEGRKKKLRFKLISAGSLSRKEEQIYKYAKENALQIYRKQAEIFNKAFERSKEQKNKTRKDSTVLKSSQI